MRFMSIFSALALAGAVTALLPPQVVADDMQKLTELATKTNEIAKQMNSANMGTFGPKILEGMKTILRVGEESISDIEASKKSQRSLKARQACLDNPEDCADDSAKFIRGPSARNMEKRFGPKIDCSLLKTFVQVFDQLLNTIVEKDKMLQAAKLDVPLGAVLQKMQSYVDSLGLAIMSVTPECPDVTPQKSTLDASFNKALSTYQA